MTQRGPFRKWVVGFAICVAAVVFSVAYVDRPVADFFDSHVRHSELFVYLERFLAPFLLVPLAALLFLLAAGGWAVSGRKLAAWTSAPLLCSWSLMWGLTAEAIFKRIFGRNGPDPMYVRYHLYGFHPLHANLHNSAFPSGHAIGAVGIVTVLWIMTPRFRIPSVLLAAAVMSAMLVNNFHWLSDMFAGAFLGLSIGWMTVRLQSDIAANGGKTR